MEVQTRHDLFEPGDKTALVCIDEAEIQQAVVDQLGNLDYKIHTGLFTEDIVLKLRTHSYDALVIYENFGDADLDSNRLLAEAVKLPAKQRRKQFQVLIGPSLATNDEFQAFEQSVDLVFGVSDLPNFSIVFRRGAARHREFYATFDEILKATDDH